MGSVKFGEHDTFLFRDLGEVPEININKYTEDALHLLHRRKKDGEIFYTLPRKRNLEAQHVVPVTLTHDERVFYVRFSDITARCVAITEDDAKKILDGTTVTTVRNDSDEVSEGDTCSFFVGQHYKLDSKIEFPL